jgi:hypothetical protein
VPRVRTKRALPRGAIKPGSRIAVLRRREPTCFSSVSDDEVGDDKARSARSELGKRSNQTQLQCSGDQSAS